MADRKVASDLIADRSVPARKPAATAGLVATFFDAAGHISAERIAARFGMSKLQLAETIGLTRETVYGPARQGSPRAQARATEMLEIVSRIADWAGGEKQAMAVRDYLDHVAVGGFV